MILVILFKLTLPGFVCLDLSLISFQQTVYNLGTDTPRIAFSTWYLQVYWDWNYPNSPASHGELLLVIVPVYIEKSFKDPLRVLRQYPLYLGKYNCPFVLIFTICNLSVAGHHACVLVNAFKSAHGINLFMYIFHHKEWLQIWKCCLQFCILL